MITRSRGNAGLPSAEDVTMADTNARTGEDKEESSKNENNDFQHFQWMKAAEHQIMDITVTPPPQRPTKRFLPALNSENLIKASRTQMISSDYQPSKRKIAQENMRLELIRRDEDGRQPKLYNYNLNLAFSKLAGGLLDIVNINRRRSYAMNCWKP